MIFGISTFEPFSDTILEFKWDFLISQVLASKYFEELVLRGKEGNSTGENTVQER